MNNNEQTSLGENHASHVALSRNKPSYFAWRSILFIGFIILVAAGAFVSGGCSHKMTKTEWRQKVDTAFPGVANSGMVAWESKKFTQLMGNPDSTQTVGDEAYWYYNCSDGKIQIVINSTLLNTGGVMSGRINDY